MSDGRGILVGGIACTVPRTDAVEDGGGSEQIVRVVKREVIGPIALRAGKVAVDDGLV
jgi:hypothetical protein